MVAVLCGHRSSSCIWKTAVIGKIKGLEMVHLLSGANTRAGISSSMSIFHVEYCIHKYVSLSVVFLVKSEVFEFLAYSNLHRIMNITYYIHV